jgi:hypothetical protein
MIPDAKLISALPGIIKTSAARPSGGLKGLGIIARVSGDLSAPYQDTGI